MSTSTVKEPSPAPTEKARTHPIPLADRKRFVHDAKDGENKRVTFTDWASI